MITHYIINQSPFIKGRSWPTTRLEFNYYWTKPTSLKEPEQEHIKKVNIKMPIF